MVPFEEEHLPRSTILGALGSILSSTWTDFFPEQGHFRPGISHFELILPHFVVVVLVVVLVLGEGILIMPTPIEPDGFACSKPVRLLQLASDEAVGVAWKDLARWLALSIDETDDILPIDERSSTRGKVACSFCSSS